ncbi:MULTISPECIES: FMN-dependent NADH-azoreductase [Cytobacillus]|uniref:FMN dependent NADH:quinone oxidoreductase n=1 Tax=Cytobacillus kochii TaxID=859143 RepID=A0A248TKE5_9BACI|nr:MULTISPECIES: NAD(P)H-dependent oxidoreductase [Cytobacillus]ASV68560.1 FMN-dependent NADH-azoreductase [Cytobacillus kochii]MEA1855211.1 NAD(P)H-dependent oxidoreductase [Cytobacillus sp. OWB-43]
MSKLLIINAHPEVESTSSVSLNVLNHFKNVYKGLQSEDEVIEQIDLYSEEVPMINKIVLNAWAKLAKNQELTNEEKEVTNRMSAVLQQFKSANKYVIVLPLHNFNVPTKLKDYMDNILIAKETFKYTENGSIGLLNDGRSMLVIQGSGGIYTNNDWYTEVEYSHKYLKSMFNFIGIEDYHMVRAQGTALLERETILENAYIEVEKIASELAQK